jgi:hypothetical protein
MLPDPAIAGSDHSSDISKMGEVEGPLVKVCMDEKCQGFVVECRLELAPGYY